MYRNKNRCERRECRLRGFIVAEQPAEKKGTKLRNSEVSQKEIELNWEIVTKEKEEIDIISVTMSYIADFEGFKKCSYWDVKQWSIWFWTKSYKWECITREEALDRKKEFVKPILERIPSCFTENQRIALTSYIYNTWGNQMRLPSYIKNCDQKSVRYIMTQRGWNLPGLIKRRTLELEKFDT